MSLSKSRASVQEKGIVGISRRFGDRKARGVREHVVAPDDKSIETVFGIEVGVLYFGAIGWLHRCRGFLRRISGLLFQNKADVIFLSEKLGNSNFEEITVVLGNIGQLELVIGRDPHDDQVVLDVGDIEVLDPCLVGNIAEPVVIADMLLDIEPALFDDLIVHKCSPNS